MPEEKILLAHGSRGKLSHDLIKQIFLPRFLNPFLEPLDDSAKITNRKGPIAFTTDSYVVNPIFFPGGDIGKLAVCGTVNDLSMIGAVPSYLSLSMIVEEGFPIELLKQIVSSIHKAAEQAGVYIVTEIPKWWNMGQQIIFLLIPLESDGSGQGSTSQG